MGDVIYVVLEIIQGYWVVCSFGGEVYEEKCFYDVSQSNIDKQLWMIKIGVVYMLML